MSSLSAGPRSAPETLGSAGDNPTVATRPSLGHHADRDIAAIRRSRPVPHPGNAAPRLAARRHRAPEHSSSSLSAADPRGRSTLRHRKSTHQGAPRAMSQVLETTTRNGVDTQVMYGTLAAITADPSLGRFRFRVHNRWIDGAHNRSTIKGFYGAGQEDGSRTQEFLLDAGEPAVLLGVDTGPNPAEALLHALAACLTTSLVYVAAARKVNLTEVESVLEGNMDVRGCLGVSDEVRNGFSDIRVRFTISGDAPEEKLREIVERAKARSAVFDMVSHGVPVTVESSCRSN